MELEAGVLLNGRYRVVRKLGQGGMGAVYLAEDTSLSHEVAVKINRNPGKESSSQFLREARLLATLRHPNLPRVTDYFILDPDQVLVMDYIAGEDIGSLLEKEGAQPVAKMLEWAEQLGGALTYLHGQTPPVIHRDIKPGNIKLNAAGEAVLVDFGIAKSSDTAQATATGALGYTPGYAPPEQYGAARTGPYSDQYALAATLYQLITGQKPVDSIERVINKVELVRVAALNPAVPAHVRAAIERGLAIRPEDRFVSVQEFVRSLRDAAFRATPPPMTRRTTPTRGGPRWWVWALLAAALGAGALVAAGAGGYLLYRGWQSGGQRNAAATEEPAMTEALAAAVEASPTDRPKATRTAAKTAAPEPTETNPAPVAAPSVTPAATMTPAVIGNGGVVAFCSDRADGTTLQIWGMQVALDSNGQGTAFDFKQITFDDTSKSQPAWSPDGKYLLYAAKGSGERKDLGLDIWRVNADGSDPVDLTRRRGDDLDPAWSPDGRNIAFTATRDDGVHQIYLMNPDGSNPQRLSEKFIESAPTWAPGMDWLAYVISNSGNDYLYLRAKANGFAKPEPFDLSSIFGREGRVAEPRWSPDGSRITYTRLKGAAKILNTVVFKSHGSEVSALTNSMHDYAAAWSPDSRWVAFTSERDDNSEIYLMTSTGKMQTNLTKREGRDLQPAWQPAP